jgi:neutral ceramidase
MIKKIFLFLFAGIILLSVTIDPAEAVEQVRNRGWKAGLASIIITPEEPVWMAGYAIRDRPPEGILHDLWAKALALEDAQGNLVVLVTTDLLGFPQNISNRIRDQLAIQYGLKRSQIVLSSSHTHGGPVLMDALFDIYPFGSEHIEIIKRYSDNLEKQIVELTGKAIDSMVPAKLFSENGVVRFQVNRRNNPVETLFKEMELKGPVDHAVPVIRVAGASGELMAVVFGYACHPTTLIGNEFSGDYAGFAQIEIERLHPGAVAMFFQGAGADMDPVPRRTIPLARQYGLELAAAVERVLQEDMKELEPVILTAYSEVNLAFSDPPGREELTKLKDEGTGYMQRWAVSQLARLAEKKSFPADYPYPVQIWRLGNQPIMIMGGEVVVEYSIELKKLFGYEIFVMGYANDVMAYIPSETVIQEGGYEGASAQMVYGMPAKWKPGLQDRIINEFRKLAHEVGLRLSAQ